MTLGGIKRSNQGHLVFIGLYIILSVLLDSVKVNSCPRQIFKSLTVAVIRYCTQCHIHEHVFFKCLLSYPYRVPVTVPAGLAAFPNDASVTPRTLCEIRFKDIKQYTMMTHGGHFAAMEEPRLLADDLFAFVKKVEQE